MKENSYEDNSLKALDSAKNLMIREFRYLDAFQYFEKCDLNRHLYQAIK